MANTHITAHDIIDVQTTSVILPLLHGTVKAITHNFMGSHNTVELTVTIFEPIIPLSNGDPHG